MPLKVMSFATYLSMRGSQWRDDDFNAYRFVRALKGRPLTANAMVPVRGRRLVLHKNNPEVAIDWFADIAASHIRRSDTDLVLVPVPNSSCVSTAPNIVPRTALLATALASRLTRTRVIDCLRWKQVLPSASTGNGTRNPQLLYDNLELLTRISGFNIVLVDDVKTSGGHLLAARAVLMGNDGMCSTAVCAARTVWNQNQAPFSYMVEDLREWWPT